MNYLNRKTKQVEANFPGYMPHGPQTELNFKSYDFFVDNNGQYTNNIEVIEPKYINPSQLELILK